MTTQKEVFMAAEGDEWFSRNEGAYPNGGNLVAEFLRSIELAPKKVLEVGCSNGFRLAQIKQMFGCDCFGIDPSKKAVSDGLVKFPNLNLSVGTAENLNYEDRSFDTVIFGFCLYLCDRGDLFKIACEADRVLQDGGTLIITDFFPPFPYRNRYSHRAGLYSYKMNYGGMFLWNPAYSEAARVVYSHAGFKSHDIPDERVATIVLRKNERWAYAEEPYKP